MRSTRRPRPGPPPSAVVSAHPSLAACPGNRLTGARGSALAGVFAGRTDGSPAAGNWTSVPQPSRERSKTTTNRRRALFDQAVAIIELRCSDPALSVPALAGAIFASPRHLQRCFEEQGTTVRAMITEIRMDRAAALLRGSSLAIRDVGHLVGYHEQAQFAKAFARHHGLPPRAWRRAQIDGRPAGRAFMRGEPGRRGREEEGRAASEAEG
jgi:AraC-like DNA-binding protein